MTKTDIEWATDVWNPTAGCDRVSPGCDHCYAMTMAKRLKGMGQAKYQLDGDPRTSGPGFLAHEWPDALDWPLTVNKPMRVFVNSMSDLFHDRISDEYIARVWQVMGAAPQHTYQILTKRHARMRSWVTRWHAGEIPEPCDVRPVAGYPGYTVSTLGQVFGKRADTRGGLSLDVGEQGHCRVTMHRDGSPKSGDRELVHRLVLTTFVRPARPGEQACHRNGDPGDNRLSNLYWGTQEDNWRDRIRHGNGRSHSKLSEADVAAMRARSDAGESAYRIAQDYPVSDTQVRNILRGDQWAAAELPARVVPPSRAVLDSVWLGVSVENQQWADIRIPALLDTPAAVRFLSCEPLLGPVDLDAGEFLRCGNDTFGHECRGCTIDWVIVGGESGRGARLMQGDWARAVRDQCVAAGVPFLFKQWGEWAPTAKLSVGHLSSPRERHGESVDDGKFTVIPWRRLYERVGKKAAGRELDGRTWDEYPAARA